MRTRGLSRVRLGRLRKSMTGYVERGEVPGIVTGVRRYGEVHVDVVGKKSLDGPDPMRRDTIFRIASMSKPITAAATMILAEEGRLRLDDAVEKWLPELADRKVLKRIEFEFDRSVILPVSYPILDEVVSLLKANPTIRHVVIEGHTDNQGTAEYNQKLSEDRANSVMAYLVDKGVESIRLSAKGFGFDRPRATNDTDEGRQRNRRVEFHITEQAGGPQTVQAK